MAALKIEIHTYTKMMEIKKLTEDHEPDFHHAPS